MLGSDPQDPGQSILNCSVTFCAFCSVFFSFQPLSSASSAELNGRQAETSAAKDDVPETSNAAAAAAAAAASLSPEEADKDVGQARWRQRASGKSGVTPAGSGAADVLAKLLRVRRKMKVPDDDVITAV